MFLRMTTLFSQTIAALSTNCSYRKGPNKRHRNSACVQIEPSAASSDAANVVLAMPQMKCHISCLSSKVSESHGFPAGMCQLNCICINLVANVATQLQMWQAICICGDSICVPNRQHFRQHWSRRMTIMMSVYVTLY